MIFIISMLKRRIELSAGPGGTLLLAPGLMVAILATITMKDLTHGDIPTHNYEDKYNISYKGLIYTLLKQYYARRKLHYIKKNHISMH